MLNSSEFEIFFLILRRYKSVENDRRIGRGMKQNCCIMVDRGETIIIRRKKKTIDHSCVLYTWLSDL